MSIASGVTMMGRRVAEGLMESSCTIKRQNGTTVDANGVETPTYDTIYTGKCRLRLTDARAADVDAVGQNIEKQLPTLSIPVAATGSASVRPDDIAVVTSPLDTATTITCRVTGIHSQTHSTARRFPVEVQT